MDTAAADGQERRVALLLDTVPYFGLVVSVVLTALFAVRTRRPRCRRL
ncbi:hypothetical protein [Peterkaempfera sp. SMS 1(5)a]